METALNVLTNIIINQYFSNFSCVYIFYDKESFFQYEGSIPVIYMDKEFLEMSQAKPYMSIRCNGFIVNVLNPEHFFQNLESHLRYEQQRYNSRRYLFIPIRENSTTQDIFNTKAIEYVADVLVIGIRNAGIYNSLGVKYNATIRSSTANEPNFIFDLFTHVYTGRSNNNKVVLLESWFFQNKTFLYGANLYPDKLSQQHGRSFKIATFTYKPYAVPAEVPEKSDGTEVNLALLYAKVCNMTPYLVIDEKGQWGKVFKNFTGYGVIGNLAMDKADVGLGALYTWEHEYYYLDLAKPSTRTGITCIVPAPRPAQRWISPVLAFPISVWVVICMSILVSFSSILFISFLRVNSLRLSERLRQVFIDVYKMMLVQPLSIKRIPRRYLYKGVYGFIFVLALFLSVFYGSGYATNMTVPRFVGAIKTVSDLADSDVRWGATSDAWISSIMSENRSDIVKLLNKFVIANETDLRNLGRDRFAFAIERLSGGNFAVGNYVERDIISNYRVLEEDIYWEYSILMLRKHSILLPSLDMFILRIAQGGFIKYWETQVATKHLDTTIQKALKSRDDNVKDIVKLNWNHIEGAFGIWLFGIFLSFATFLLEIFIFRKQSNFIN